MSAALRPPFVLKGVHVLFAILGFFALVFSVDAGFTVMAVRTFPGEVSATPYEDGLRYNRILAARTRQAELGWSAAIETGREAGVVDLRLRDDAGAPLAGLSVRGLFERPATDRGRKPVRFTEIAPGHYRARAGVARGGWDLVVTAVDAKARSLEIHERVVWR